MIKRLSGKTHLGHTSVIIHLKNGKVAQIEQFTETTIIEFSHIPENTIIEYCKLTIP